MKNCMKVSIAAMFAFVIGLSVNNFAFSDAFSSRIAVVDVQQVVAASSQVKALKDENEAKASELMSYIEEYQRQGKSWKYTSVLTEVDEGEFIKEFKYVASANDADKKRALEEKYSKELNAKREAYGSEYNNKMQEIQNTILNAIREQAKANNYDIVIAKDVVLYGGDDITNELKTAVANIKVQKKTTTNKKK